MKIEVGNVYARANLYIRLNKESVLTACFHGRTTWTSIKYVYLIGNILVLIINDAFIPSLNVKNNLFSAAWQVL